MTCDHELDDGAYILGALVPAERAAFERHLPACPPCRESIAQLAVLPGLLGRLAPDMGGATLISAPTATAPEDLLSRVLGAARISRRTQRRRRILAAVAAALAAATLTASVGVGVQLLQERATEAEALVYSSMDSAGTRVEAEIGIQAQEAGTLVAVRCLYHGESTREWPIWLVVFPRGEDDEAEPIGSWVATAGSQVHVTAVTHYTPAQIDHIELQGVNNTTLAWWTPDR